MKIKNPNLSDEDKSMSRRDVLRTDPSIFLAVNILLKQPRIRQKLDFKEKNFLRIKNTD